MVETIEEEFGGEKKKIKLLYLKNNDAATINSKVPVDKLLRELNIENRELFISLCMSKQLFSNMESIS